MAKKRTTETQSSGTTPQGARRRTSGGAGRAAETAAPGETPAFAAPAPAEIDSAADMSVAPSSGDSAAGRDPSYDDIAHAAYLRYLERGGQHGQDWDDWLEAERSLRQRR